MALQTPKLYVGCGLTNAPEVFRDSVENLKDVLKQTYDVFDFIGLSGGTAEDVYRWDIEHCVADCDMFIGVCDYPSIGLGWELSEAVRLEKPVLGVAHETAKVTRMIIGAAAVKPNFEFQRYTRLEVDVPAMVDERVLALQGTLKAAQVNI